MSYALTIYQNAFVVFYEAQSKEDYFVLFDTYPEYIIKNNTYWFLRYQPVKT